MTAGTAAALGTVDRTAAEIFAAAGVEEDPAFYGSFDSEAERAVLSVPQFIRAAWAANDADFFADVFAANGSLLLQDTQLTSREEIRAYMAAGFAGPLKGARVGGWPLTITPLGPGAAMVVTQGGIILAGESEIAPAREIRAVWIVAAEDDRWRLVSHQSSPIRG